MASMAQLIYQQSANALSNADPNSSSKMLNEGLRTGAALALQKQQLEQARMEMEQQKEVVQLKKLGLLTESIHNGMSKVPQKARPAFFKNFVVPQAQQLGINVDQSFFDALTSPDMNGPMLAESFLNYRTGIANLADTRQLTPELKEAGAKMLQAMGGDTTLFAEFTNKAFGQENQRIAQQMSAEAAASRQQQSLESQARLQQVGIQADMAAKETELAMTPQRKLKEKAGQMYSEYVVLGESGVNKKLNGLKEVLRDLENGKIKTRTVKTLGIAAIPFGDQLSQLSVVDPALKSAVDKVRGAVSLKGALDSQFSVSEANQVYSRAFDINATREQNIEKVKAMINELEVNKVNAMKLYKDEGLIKSGDGIQSGANQPMPKFSQQEIDQIKALISAVPEYRGLPRDQVKMKLVEDFGVDPKLADDILRDQMKKEMPKPKER